MYFLIMVVYRIIFFNLSLLKKSKWMTIYINYNNLNKFIKSQKKIIKIKKIIIEINRKNLK